MITLRDCLFFSLFLGCLSVHAEEGSSSHNIPIINDTILLPTYSNPVIQKSLPDPTVIRGKDGYYYLYSTESTKNLPIWRSNNLVDWEFVGTAFTKETHPNFLEDGDLWAPDINYIDGKYVLYYSLSKMREYEKNGIGVAISDNPSGPFVDCGKLFTSEEIGVVNSIDEFYYEEDGIKYLFWGSFRGIYGIELSEDGLSVRKNAKKIPVAGSFMEAVAIEKRGDYYYLFGSAGSCCNGVNSKYHITYGRSNNLFGPYVTKDGKLLMDNNYETLILGNDKVAGPGHQSRLITDDKGQDWIIYHGYLIDKANRGRVIFIDKVEWIDGWPYVKNYEPSEQSEHPYFETNK